MGYNRASLHEQEAFVQKLSRRFYLASVGVAHGIPLCLLSFAVLEGGWRKIDWEDEATIFVLELPALYGVGVMLMLFYKMWAAIQDNHALYTPFAAVAFFFVPVVNLYWVFAVTFGWARGYNAYVDRYSLKAPKVPTGLFLAYPILGIVAVLLIRLFGETAPGLGLMPLIASFVVLLVMVSAICKAVNALVVSKQPTAAG